LARFIRAHVEYGKQTPQRFSDIKTPGGKDILNKTGLIGLLISATMGLANRGGRG
jgi:hypothetical protein